MMSTPEAAFPPTTGSMHNAWSVSDGTSLLGSPRLGRIYTLLELFTRAPGGPLRHTPCGKYSSSKDIFIRMRRGRHAFGRDSTLSYPSRRAL